MTEVSNGFSGLSRTGVKPFPATERSSLFVFGKKKRQTLSGGRLFLREYDTIRLIRLNLPSWMPEMRASLPKALNETQNEAEQIVISD